MNLNDFSYMDILVASAVRIYAQRPKLNRFTIGNKNSNSYFDLRLDDYAIHIDGSDDVKQAFKDWLGIS